MTTVKNDISLILEDIYNDLDIETALAELEPKNRGASYVLKCPQCSKSRAFIYKGGRNIICNRRNECGYSSTLWDYITQRDGLTTNQETLQALAKLSGYNLPNNLSKTAQESFKRAQEKQSKLETAQNILTSRLFSEDGKKELQYLHDRGYSDDDIKAMGLGALPPKKALENRLDDLLVNNVNIVNIKIPELSNLDYKTHSLTIPIRDKRGRLKGWSVRSISGAEPKYKYSYGIETGSELANLDRARGLKELIIVESPIDALIATARGIEGVTACMRSKPTEAMLDDLKNSKVRSVTLALDSDEAGQKGTVETLYALYARGLTGYVMTYPKGIKDLDELIKKQGADKAQKLIDTAEAGHKYLIKCLHCKHCKHENITDREEQALLDDLINLDAKLSDDLASRDIVRYITEELKIAPELIKARLEQNRADQAQRQRERGHRTLNLKASQFIAQGELDKAEELYKKMLPSLRAKNSQTILEPYTGELFYRDLLERREGYKTGWSKLDQYSTIPPEALTIIAGRPSHGKTTVMLNMLYNLVKAYPDESFYLFSYEETRASLALKLITLIAGVQLDQYQNTQKIEEYFKTGRLDAKYAKGLTESQAKEKLNQARDEYDNLIQSGRLWIIDEPLAIADLTTVIDSLKGKAGAIFIDYIQKIKSQYNVQSRQVEIQKISGDLLDSAKRAGVALILGAQLNRDAETTSINQIKLDQLRESGDIEQDAHLVIALYNQERGAYDRDSTDRQLGSQTTIDLKLLKNRSGATNVYTSLLFNTPVLKLEEDE